MIDIVLEVCVDCVIRDIKIEFLYAILKGFPLLGSSKSQKIRSGLETYLAFSGIKIPQNSDYNAVLIKQKVEN